MQEVLEVSSAICSVAAIVCVEWPRTEKVLRNKIICEKQFRTGPLTINSSSVIPEGPQYLNLT